MTEQFQPTTSTDRTIDAIIDAGRGAFTDLVNGVTEFLGPWTGLDNPLVDSNQDINGAGLQSQYRWRGFNFPSDVGAESMYNTHYMIINISRPKIARNPVLLPGETNLPTEINNNAGFNLQFGGLLSQYTTFNMVDTTITLYMPNTVVFSQANQYEDISLTSIASGPLSNFLSKTGTLSAVAGAAKQGAQLAGAIINPMTEVLFSNTAQRQFQFEFLFAPESQEETDNLKNIIKALRFHSAPELSGGDSSVVRNLFWIEPSNFDITFWNKGQPNTSIPRINTCVMEAIDVDYAPTGIYSTFSNGYPVSVRLTLRFRERNVIHKAAVNAGY